MVRSSSRANENRLPERLGSVATFFREAPLVRFGMLFFLSLVISILLSPHLFQPVGHYRLGQFTTHAIRAPFDMTVVDEESTLNKKLEALRAAVPLADMDSNLAGEIETRIGAAFAPIHTVVEQAEAMRTVPQEELKKLSWKKRQTLLKEMSKRADTFRTEQLAQHYPTLEKALGMKLSEPQRQILERIGFDPAFTQDVQTLVRDAYAQPIVLDRGRIDQLVGGEGEKPRGPGKLALRDTATGTERIIQDVGKIREKNTVLEAVETRAPELLPARSPTQRLVAVQIARNQIAPNLILNRQETRQRRLAAAEAVLPASYNFKKNQLIIGDGQEVSSQTLLVLNDLRDHGMPKQFFNRLFGTALFVFMLILLGFWIADINLDRFKLADRDFLYIALSLMVSVLIFRIWLFVASEIAAKYSAVPLLALTLVFPVGAMAMLTRFLINFEVATVQSATTAFLFGMLAGLGLPFAIYAFLVGLIAAHMIGRCQSRGEVVRAGLWTGIASAAAAICLVALSENDAGVLFLLVVLGGILGGLFCGFVVVAVSPVTEWLFGYTTDITLLELSSYEHPLLRSIMMEAPGTFQHAVAIGILGEAAAEAVGANALLVRIGALYHDAGKSLNAQFFIENQSGHNPHDNLTPLQSARIIRAHVVDGAKLVKRHGLGERICDFVLEHHGTGTIKYFLDRARKEDPTVDEAIYQYPGPRPRSRETGILMIADQVEATSRTLDSPDEDKLRAMVQRTIERILSERQLDECPLTLRDLAMIQQAFVKVLTGLRQRRVTYSEDQQKSPPGRTVDWLRELR